MNNNSTSCRSAAFDMMKKAADVLVPGMVQAQDAEVILDRACEHIDYMMQEFDAEAFQLGVNKETAELTISMICPDMVMRGSNSHRFFKALQCFSAVRFTNHDNENIRVAMTVKGLWEEDANGR